MGPDRRIDAEGRTRIDALADQMEARVDALHDTTRRAIRWLTAGFLALLIGATLVGWRVVEVSQESTELTKANRQRIADVQRSREDTVRLACAEQNERHDGTIRTLDRLILETRKMHPERARRAAESRVGTVLLIEALAPKRDCDKRVRELVHPRPHRRAARRAG